MRRFTMEIKLKKVHALAIFHVLKRQNKLKEDFFSNSFCSITERTLFTVSFERVHVYDSPVVGPIGTRPCMPLAKAVIKVRRALNCKLKLQDVLNEAVSLTLET